MHIGPRGPGDYLDNVLSLCTLQYVLSMFTGLILSITRRFSSCPNPLRSLIITTTSAIGRRVSRFLSIHSSFLAFALALLFGCHLICRWLYTLSHSGVAVGISKRENYRATLEVPFISITSPHTGLLSNSSRIHRKR